MRRAEAASPPSVKTPTATQSALNASGNAIFVLNSMGFAVPLLPAVRILVGPGVEPEASFAGSRAVYSGRAAR